MKFFARWVGPIAVALVLIGGTGYWFYWDWMSGQLIAGVDRTADRWRKRGLDVTYDPVTVTGFPYRFEINVPNWQVKAPKLTARPEWQADMLVVYLQPWKLSHAIAETRGPVRGSWMEETVRRNMVMTSSSNRASVLLDQKGELARYDSAAQDVEISGSVMLKSAKKILTNARRRLDDQGRPALDFAVRAEELKVDPEKSPLGDSIDLYRMTLAFEPEPRSTSAQDLDAWRQAGGVMQITTLEVQTGALSVTGTGSMAIDSEHRPEGAASITIRGAEAFVDAVAMAGQLSGAVRIGLQLGITALEKRDKDGNKVVRVPVTIQDGQFGLMGIGLIPVEPLY